MVLWKPPDIPRISTPWRPAGSDMWGRMKIEESVWSVFPYIKAEAERKAVNMRIQGGAQGIIKEAMVRLWVTVEKWMRDKWAWPLIQIHDDLTFEVREDKVKSAAKKLVKVMEGAVELSIPTPVDVKVGERWGRQEKLKV